MDEGMEAKRVRRVRYMDYRLWLMLITVLGLLLLGPIWAEFGLDEPQNRWIGAGVFLVGVVATIAAWRFLARSFPPTR